MNTKQKEQREKRGGIAVLIAVIIMLVAYTVVGYYHIKTQYGNLQNMVNLEAPANEWN